MRFDRIWAMPNRNTFRIKPIRELLEEEMTEGLWLDPFAGETLLEKEGTRIIRNDINEKYDTDYHEEALKFLYRFEDLSIDGVLLDPPYSPRQIAECYHGLGISLTSKDTQASFWSKVKDQIKNLVKAGGKVISFGWNSNGMGKNRGFEIIRILMVPHGSNHNDTIVTVEVKKSIKTIPVMKFQLTPVSTEYRSTVA